MQKVPLESQGGGERSDHADDDDQDQPSEANVQAGLQHELVEADQRQAVIAAAGQPTLAPQLHQYAFAVRHAVHHLEAAVDVIAVGRLVVEQQIDAFREHRRRNADQEINQIDRVEIEEVCHSGCEGSKRLPGSLTPWLTSCVRKRGRTPVAEKWPCTVPSGAMPVRTYLKISCIWMMSPSSPVISAIEVTLRLPSDWRESWTISWMAPAICPRIEATVIGRPAMPIICSRREMASRGVLACIVAIEPSWPVFIACNMSKASSPRHSPRMMRSGRIRRAFFTNSRWRISPLPSMLGGRVSMRPTCGCCS